MSQIRLWDRSLKHLPDPSDPRYLIKDRVCGNDASIQGLGFSGNTGVEIIDLPLALYSGSQIQDLRREWFHPGRGCWVVPCEERVPRHSLAGAHPATLHHDIKLEEREGCEVEDRLDQMCEVKG